MNTRLRSILPLGLILCAAAMAVICAPAPVRALVEDESFGIFGVTPVNTQPSGAAQSALTDSTGGTAGATLAAGTGITTISIPVNLPSVSTAVLTSYTPGYNFKVLAVTFSVNAPVTTAAKLATITPTITGVNITGGVLTLTSAAATPMGALIQGSSVAALNVGGPTDTISLNASSVTTFVEGSGTILLKVQNLDTANSISSVANLTNALRSMAVSLGLCKGSS